MTEGTLLVEEDAARGAAVDWTVVEEGAAREAAVVVTVSEMEGAAVAAELNGLATETGTEPEGAALRWPNTRRL